MQKGYETDILCQDIMKNLTKNDEYQKGKNIFQLKDKMLYKIGKDEPDRLLIPQNLRMLLIKNVHEDALNGHPGLNEMANKINKEYFMPNLMKSLTKYINSCVTCQTKKSAQTYKPMLSQFMKDYTPFETIHIDLVGPLFIQNREKR